jgi:2',3'-cyclic-nucleotide 2'-phosphodiesterase (5'-nucleotidase family)
MDKPENVNNILIAHSGTGTNQVGRFDIVVDDDTNSIVDYRWELVKIDDSLVPPDTGPGKLYLHLSKMKSTANTGLSSAN